MSIITTVPQGQHYDNHSGGSTHSPAAMECDVTFQSSCRYVLGNSNQYNCNKLMGFFDSPAGEVRSARWGWRWSLEKDCIEIAPFIHHAGTFVLPPVSQWIPIPLNTPIRVKVKLDRSNDQYIFTCINGGDVTTFTVSVTGPLANTYSGACRWDLLYFGGSQAAPHDVTIEFDNVVFSNCKRIHGATQSWRVSYVDGDGNRNSAYGAAYTEQIISAREGSVVVTLGNPQLADANGTC